MNKSYLKNNKEDKFLSIDYKDIKDNKKNQKNRCINHLSLQKQVNRIINNNDLSIIKGSNRNNSIKTNTDKRISTVNTKLQINKSKFMNE
jgi:hypothetical protein